MWKLTAAGIPDPLSHRVLVSLGSNIWREVNLPVAARLLGRRGRLLALSSVYETAPVGLTEQPPFLNAAALVATDLSAWDFKQRVLRPIERRLGRRRGPDANAPRTIDADITLYADQILELPDGGRVPDHDLLRYLHVAVPAAEIAPDWRHPETGEPLAFIAGRLTAAAEARGEMAPRLLTLDGWPPFIRPLGP